jgi:pSer/pThr/pTyr-binding forkhead associated (FHA) protein
MRLESGALVQMPHLLEQDAPTPPLAVPPTLRAGEQCCSLRPGVHGLGGRAEDAVPLTALASQPRVAVLTVFDHAESMLQRTTASIVVRVDGETLGIAPVQLHDGARIEFGDCCLVFESEGSPPGASRESSSSTATTGARVLSLSMGGSSGITAASRRERDATPMTGAAFVDVRSGARYPLPARRIHIGRDESCDVVVRGNSVSRRHVSVVPVAGGFMLRDESANGTQVNGVRVVGTYLLGHGDVVRIQDDELRVELDAAAPPSVARADKTTLLDLSHIMPGVTEAEARAAANRTLVASLEIVRGPFTGACFQVERAVCSIGRSEENDVRIRDDAVSLTHATLLRKRGAWFVVDLRSMNGTFVDGSRVSGERELHPGARLRVGTVELVFRAFASAAEPQAEPPSPGMWARLKRALRSIAPPSGAR